jgi:tetratricopeptide (TPR) repeat protein
MKRALHLLALLLPAALPAADPGEHPAPTPPASEPAHSTPAAPPPAPDATPATETPAAPAAPAASGPPPPTPPSQRGAEYAGLLRIGDSKLATREAEIAASAFRQALLIARDEEQAPALLGLARAHRLAGEDIKAVAVYERLLRDFPEWTGAPMAMLEVGRTLRRLGAHRLAEARFYGVIQSSLRLPSADNDHYRQLVRTAQFEIAETHLADGRHADAVRFFRRLDLLDLAPADRARARFRTAQAQLLGEDRASAILTLDRLLAQDGGAAEAAEARFLLARLHAEDGRSDEALRVTLELLRTSSTDIAADPAAWREWQRRAGHFLADHFKQNGQIHSALLLYRALSFLDDSPAWRAPLLYQVGLCLERLQQPEEARAVYDEIVTLLGGETAPPQDDLLRMARWRVSQLDWDHRVKNELRRLPAASPSPSAPPETAPAS